MQSKPKNQYENPIKISTNLRHLPLLKQQQCWVLTQLIGMQGPLTWMLYSMWPRVEIVENSTAGHRRNVRLPKNISRMQKYVCVCVVCAAWCTQLMRGEWEPTNLHMFIYAVIKMYILYIIICMLVKSENFWRSTTAESDFFAYFSLQTYTHMYVFDWEPYFAASRCVLMCIVVVF